MNLNVVSTMTTSQKHKHRQQTNRNREYYARLGKPQNMALAEPEAEKDAFAETLAKKNIVPSKPERTNEKIYYENMLNGGHVQRMLLLLVRKNNHEKVGKP